MADGVELTEAEVVRVQPGDVVLAKVPAGASSQVCDAVYADLKRLFPDNEVRVNNVDMELEIVRPSDG